MILKDLTPLVLLAALVTLAALEVGLIALVKVSLGFVRGIHAGVS